MKLTLLVTAMTIAALTIALGRGAAGVQNRPTSNDEEALKKLVHDWAMCTVQGDSANLEKFMADNFRGNAEGISFDKKMLLAALKSRQMKVGRWDCDDEAIKVNIRGNAAVVTGRCTLANATYMGKDFSGGWDFTDRFVKQKDGSWRAVSSQAKRIRQ